MSWCVAEYSKFIHISSRIDQNLHHLIFIRFVSLNHTMENRVTIGCIYSGRRSIGKHPQDDLYISAVDGISNPVPSDEIIFPIWKIFPTPSKLLHSLKIRCTD